MEREKERQQGKAEIHQAKIKTFFLFYRKRREERKEKKAAKKEAGFLLLLLRQEKFPQEQGIFYFYCGMTK